MYSACDNIYVWVHMYVKVCANQVQRSAIAISHVVLLKENIICFWGVLPYTSTRMQFLCINKIVLLIMHPTELCRIALFCLLKAVLH